MLVLVSYGVFSTNTASGQSEEAVKAMSQSSVGPALSVNFAKHVYKSLALPDFPGNASVKLRFDITKNGELKRVEFIQPQGVHLNTEAACLEAFLAAASPQLQLISEMKTFDFRLNGSNEFMRKDESPAEFYNKYPDLNGFALVHLIPLTLTERFSNEELRSVENLASIGNDRETALTTLQEIYRTWIPFFTPQKKFSRQDILDHALKIKRQFNLREGSIPPGDR